MFDVNAVGTDYGYSKYGSPNPDGGGCRCGGELDFQLCYIGSCQVEDKKAVYEALRYAAAFGFTLPRVAAAVGRGI